MPHPWAISRGKPQTIQSLVEDERAFHRSRIRRGEHDADLATVDLEDIADRIAAQAMIPVPEVDLDGWRATMDQDSDASRVTYAIPFHGDEQIVRLAVDWKSGGHAIAVLPGEIEFSIWSRDKDTAAIRAEADSVLQTVRQQWQEALALLEAYNADVRGDLLGALEERRTYIGDRGTLLDDLNRHELGGSAGPGSAPTAQP